MNLFFDNRIDWPAAVNSGRKVHTVRPALHGVHPGASLVMVTGRFTGREIFAKRVCVATQPVTVAHGSVQVAGRPVDPDAFAANGGFDSAAQMFAYYGTRSGHVIHWTDLLY